MKTAGRWQGPLLLSGLLCLSQSDPLPSPVRDAATLAWAPGFHLELPLWHLLLTPFCSLADAWTVLSFHQLLATIAAVLLLAFLFGGSKRGMIISALLLAFLAWGALVPRPMGRLQADDPDCLLIDFHSHSKASHDGRRSFTAAANQRWHRLQGYDAGFITDHNRVESAVEAKADSSRGWTSTGYRSLQGEEISLLETHLIVLGNRERIDNHPYDSDAAKVGLFVRDMTRKGLPVIASLPEYWWYHSEAWLEDLIANGLAGVEVVNSAPKALDFPLSQRMEVVHLAKRENLFITGISDNHGYGYATAVWNAMRIPGWRHLAPDALERAVIDALRRSRYSSVQVLERARPLARGNLALFANPFEAALLYWRGLQPYQLLSWMAWIWGWYWLRRRAP
jgi:hypothetical protein